MMKKIGLGLLILMLSGLMVTAETFTHQDAGMSIWFPDDWKTSVDGDILEATAPDEDAYIQLLAIKDVASLDEAVKVYSKEMDKLVTNFRTTDEGENIEVNGLTVFYLEGDGMVDGVLLDISLSMVVTPKAVVMVIAFSGKQSTQKYESDFEEIVGSIKAI